MLYRAAKAVVVARNAARPALELWPDTKQMMRRFFPSLDLERVRFKTGCSLPGNWLARETWVSAMTLGYGIYVAGDHVQESWSALELLMHELVHVDQVRRLGSERRFACEYGKGYLAGGGYRGNPLEVEAYDFVARNRLPESLPESFRVLPRPV